MHVIAKRTLREFWEAGHAKAEEPLNNWFKECKRAAWTKFADLKNTFNSADLVGDYVVFNVGGNNYRVICSISYKGQFMYILWVGTHAEYDKVDVKKL